MSTAGNLDQLSEAIPDLGLRESPQKGEIEECVHGSVVGSESVFVVAIVDGDLDADTCVDQADDGSGNTDIVGVPSVGGTSKSVIEC